MPYTRTEWMNNKTKLNATNMNNIEDGVTEANSNIANLVLDVSAVQQQADTNTGNITSLTTTVGDNKTASENADAALSGRITTLENTNTTYTDTNNDGNVVISIVTPA